MMKPLQTETLEALSELICGHGEIGIKRGGEKIEEFFQAAGLTCRSYLRSTFPHHFAHDRLIECNREPEKLQKTILQIVKDREFLKRPLLLPPTLERLNVILAPAGYIVEMDGTTPHLREIHRSFHLKSTTPSSHIPVPEFSKISPDQVWVENLRKRWDEAITCLNNDAPLSAIIMAGSILEGALLMMLQRFPSAPNQAQGAPREQNGNVKRFQDWRLAQMIDVAHELTWLPRDAKQFSHVLRDYRNLIHPHAQIRAEENPSTDTAKICFQVVQTAIGALLAYIDSQGPTLPSTA